MKDDDPSTPLADANPYAPPTTESIGEPDERYPWFTAARAVFVKDGAELPAIDLCGASPETPLVRTTRTLTKSKPSAIVLSIAIMLAVIFFVEDVKENWIRFLLLVFVGSYVLRSVFHFVFPNFWMKRAKFAFHCTPDLGRFRKRITAASIAATAVCFAPAFIVPDDYRIITLFGGIFAVRAIAHGFKKLALKRYPLEMHFSEGHSGWIRLSGAHPDAMQRLQEIEAIRERNP